MLRNGGLISGGAYGQRNTVFGQNVTIYEAKTESFG